MSIKDKILQIFLNTAPIILMVGLIPVFEDDYVLLGAYAAIIVIAFGIRHEKKDCLFFVFGLLVMAISEYFFISTGVETFERKSLLGLMPVWLPVLWAYAFVAMRRAIVILDK